VAALRALHAEAVAGGARVLRGRSVERIEEDGRRVRLQLRGGGVVAARATVVAAGFHAPALLPELRGRIAVTRQVELFFDAPDDLGSFPVFADLDGGFYGFPPRGRAVKVADHRKGPVVTDLDARPPPTGAEVAAARAWLAAHLPALVDAPLARWRVCLYDNAPDDRFILGPSRDLPRVVVAAGMSGHAFKFAPALGEELADMATAF
jgi:glycine/D-amino acid oxidase-like deaminating enzyme